MKKALIIIGSLILIGFFVYWIGGGGQKETKARPKTKRNREIPVETVLLKRGSLVFRLKLTGTVRPEAEVDVFSKVQGILERLRVEQGDRVKVDQVIAQVEREEREAQVQEAQAALEVLRAKWAQMQAGARPEEIDQAEELVRQARARMVNSFDNFKRLKGLKERNVIAQQRIDEAKLQVTLSGGIKLSQEEIDSNGERSEKGGQGSASRSDSSG